MEAQRTYTICSLCAYSSCSAIRYITSASTSIVPTPFTDRASSGQFHTKNKPAHNYPIASYTGCLPSQLALRTFADALGMPNVVRYVDQQSGATQRRVAVGINRVILMSQWAVGRKQSTCVYWYMVDLVVMLWKAIS